MWYVAEVCVRPSGQSFRVGVETSGGRAALSCKVASQSGSEGKVRTGHSCDLASVRGSGYKAEEGWGGVVVENAREEMDEEHAEAEKTTDCIRPMTVSTRSTRSQPNETGLGGWWVVERGRERACRRRGSAQGRTLDVVDGSMG